MNKKNKFVEFEKFFGNYLLTLSNTVGKINLDNLFKAANLITKTIKKNKYIYVCGNGGSAAIADHYICDYFKQLI
jgi:D-sedoheptulose 7-phosphate isomerase